MEPNILIGLGAGHCGFSALRELLSRQPQTKVTVEDPPLLPWKCRDADRRVRERIMRLRSSAVGMRLLSDIAAFYLPYATELLNISEEIRLICLMPPLDQFVSGFVRQIDSVARVPTNHWSEQLLEGWYHDPLWSRSYPKYDTNNRSEAIEFYYRDYYQQAELLAKQYPEKFLLLESGSLCSELEVQRILDYALIPKTLQNLWVCPADRLLGTFAAPREYNVDRLDPRKCVILVPFGMFIHQECDRALKELERRGYEVRRVGGYAAIDQGRNQMATDALLDGFEETFWIDSDVGFHPDDIEKIRRHNQPIVCGIYPQKGKRALACHVMPSEPSITFGKEGGLIEIQYAGAGFLNIRRQAYQQIQKTLDLPMCNERFGSPMIPFFHPMIREIEEAHWYLAEDYAFCERARMCGVKILADTSVRLWHVGYYRYGWEDAGMDRPRYDSFSMNFRDVRATRSETSQNDEGSLKNLASRFPWPEIKPQTSVIGDRMWLLPSVRRALADTIKLDDQCILELGCWIGRSSRYILDLAEHAYLICLDPWEGYPFSEPELEGNCERENLFEAFIAESWDFQNQIIPLRMDFLKGLHEIADSGIRPSVLFFNAITDCPEMLVALIAAIDLFPGAILIGHCYDRPPVANELERLRAQRKFRLDTLGTAWRIAARR